MKQAISFILMLVVLAACDTMVPITAWPEPAEGEPRIVLDPTSGPVEAEVTVSGTYFPPGTLVNIYLGPAGAEVIPEAIASSISDEDGRFEIEITIPGQWPNGDPLVESMLLIAAATEDYSTTAVAQFNLEPGGSASSPTLLVTPDAGIPGDLIEITGRDFPSGTQIAIRLGVPQSGLGEQNLAEVAVDDQGNLAVTVSLPMVWPGTDNPVIEETLIIAAVDESIGQTLATATFVNTNAGEFVTTEPTEKETTP